MKKIIALVLLFSFAGCSLLQKPESENNQVTDPENTESQIENNQIPTSKTEVTQPDQIEVPEINYKSEAIINLDFLICEKLNNKTDIDDCIMIVRNEILKNSSENKDNTICKKLISEADIKRCEELAAPEKIQVENL